MERTPIHKVPEGKFCKFEDFPCHYYLNVVPIKLRKYCTRYDSYLEINKDEECSPIKCLACRTETVK
jgi:hypothetical protein